ncbi:cytochrome P450 [Melanomma pulvis-pyrius CBS 109.77]|uniref:Cytochrome P450 n=1 Tax=Melanomma pulvis-pyrius CBS 109.77 TaxID=1314802 RepID=A0A6A6WS75_9PLEO|nr:cytochrome P450 [Melanomma pulvis-pyrius CBS 109.77]
MDATVPELPSLYSSLLIYRLVYHPLNRFPGPVSARISDLWLSLQAKDFDWHKKSLALYYKYGPFVRIGSSTLLIMHPQGVPAMYGPQSKCRRAELYTTFGAPYGILSPDPAMHRERRRIWSLALRDSALRGYEARIRSYTKTFIDVLSNAAEQKRSLDVAKWCTYLAWDVMGDIGLDQDFSLLRTGEEHWAFTLLAGWTKAMGIRLPPWLVTLLKSIPASGRAAQKFDNFCNAQLDAIMASEKSGAKSSMLGIMISHAGPHPSQDDLLHLQSDCRSIIFAGSDTSASTLTFVFYYLAKHPEQAAKLRQELLPLAGPDGCFAHQNIQNANHLNAVIHETLRLHPPGSVIPRQTPPEGIEVDGTFVPGNMTVIGSQYVLGRSEEVYDRPLEFLPERWHSKPDLIKDRAGYAPFNIGTHYCVGRPLALMVFRLVIAHCITQFDVQIPLSYDGTGFLDNVQEAHTWRLPNLQLCFRSCMTLGDVGGQCEQ